MRFSRRLFDNNRPSSNNTTADQGQSKADEEKDVALAFVGEHAQPIDPEVEARVVRKVDLFLIPAMVIGEHAEG
jgi:hypothetical protein